MLRPRRRGVHWYVFKRWGSDPAEWAVSRSVEIEITRIGSFPTWREAIDFAFEQARNYERH